MLRAALLVAAVSLACFGAPSADAGNLTVAPTRIDLGTDQATGSVTLENNGAEATLVQVETFAWLRTPLTRDLEPTRQLVAVPAVFELAPGAKQVIRVALRQPHQGPKEDAYRLLITEVPSETAGGGVRFALRLSLPVFATPPGATARPEWRLERRASGLRLALANTGSAHLLVQRMRLSAGGKVQAFEEPAYVLAGQNHDWEITLPDTPGRDVKLDAETNLGPLSDTLVAQGLRLGLALLLAACWSDRREADEARAPAAPIDLANGRAVSRVAGALPLPPPRQASAPRTTVIRPALPDPILIEQVAVDPVGLAAEPAAGPRPAAPYDGEVVWPERGGGPQPTVGPRRDPVEPPLLDDEAWRSWVFAVRLNGALISQGSVFLESPEDGRLLAGVAQLRLWRVIIDESRVLSLQGDAYYPLDAIPGLQLAIDRQALEIALSIPAEALEAFVADAEQATAPPPSMGRGGFLDYDILASGGDNLDQRLDGLLELGAFGELGVLTSGLLADDLLANPSLTRLETTFTRDLPESRASLRFGDSLTGGGALALPVRFGGLQWATNFATDPTFVTFPVPAIGGLANESSVVDVFVDNLRQATTDVPAGPFQINNIPVVTGAGEVQLVVRDLLGRETIVTQPYYVSSRLLREGLHDYSYELGVLRRRYGERSFDYGDPLASATHRYGLSPHLTLEAHADAAPDVQSVAAGGSLRLDRFGVLSAALAGSLDDGTGGAALDLGYEYIARRFSVGARTRYGSDDFAQTGDPQRGGRTDQANLGVDLGPLGRVGLLAVSQEREDADDVRSLAATWSLRLGPGNLMVRGAQFIDPDDDYIVAAVYALPLGDRRSGSVELEKRKDGQRARAQFRQGRGASDLGLDYRVGGELGDEESGADARVSYQTTKGAVDVEVEGYGGDTNLRAGINGSIGLVDGTLRASRRLGRAFAVVVAPGFANVRVYLDNREVGRTDANGKLMLPQLRPYEVNRLRLEVADLPLEARIGSPETVAVPYDRSGVTVSFDVAQERQATAFLLNSSGSPLPAGLRLADAMGRVSAVVGKAGFAQIVVAGAGGAADLKGEHDGRALSCTVPELPADATVPDLGRILCR